MLEKKDIEVLSAPFDEKTLGVKVQSLSRDKTKAMLVCYLQHTDVYVRIEQVDPSWSCEVISEHWDTESVNARVRMTIKGVSRENAGEGSDLKSALSDAIKRAAMLFGVGRYLYDSETVWVPYNEQTDRFKVFTLVDYNNALKQARGASATSSPKPTETVKTPNPSGMVIKPVASKSSPQEEIGFPEKPKSVAEIRKAESDEMEKRRTQLFTLAKEKGWGTEDVQKYMFEAFGARMVRELRTEQYQQLTLVITGSQYLDAMAEIQLNKGNSQGDFDDFQL